MTKHDFKQHAYYMIYLIRCVLHDQIPKKEKLDKIDLSKLYEVAEKHSLTAITAYSLERAGVVDDRFTQAKAKAIRKNALFDIERQHILNEFEKVGIWYMPLKGIILKEYYPKIGMRQMCDNDILFDKSRVENVKVIMSSLGFTMKHDDSGHDLEFIKKPVCNFEMHTELFGVGHNPIYNQYYSDVKKKLIPQIGCECGYQFSAEDFYIFMNAHEYKHYNDLGGIGIRALIDKYIYISRFGDFLDMKYTEAELNKLGIKEYELKSRGLVQRLLLGNKLSDSEKELLDYYIFCGTYGRTENLVNNRVKSLGGGVFARIQYALTRALVPFSQKNPHYKAFKAQYPLFYQYKILLPLLPFYRLFRGLKHSKGRIITEIKTLIKL